MKIAVIAHPNSKKPRVELKLGVLHAYASRPPVEGKANSEVLKAVAEHFGVSLSRVRLLRGHTSKQKLLEIDL